MIVKELIEKAFKEGFELAITTLDIDYHGETFSYLTKDELSDEIVKYINEDGNL